MSTLIHLSDLHFGRLDVPVAEALVGYVEGIGADLVVVSGDLTQRARADQFLAAMGYLERFKAPKLIVPGNHDVPLYALWERFTRPLDRYKRFVSRELTPTWESDDAYVVGVNTARAFVPVWDGFWKDGAMSADQLACLGVRPQRAWGKLTVVVAHHPLLPSPGTHRGGTLRYPQGVAEGMVMYRVDVVLGGHLHAAYRGSVPMRFDSKALLRVGRAPPAEVMPGRSVLSVQAGTATSFRRRCGPDGREYANSFNVLRVGKDELEIEVHAFGSGESGSETTGWRKKSSQFFERNQVPFGGFKPRS